MAFSVSYTYILNDKYTKALISMSRKTRAFDRRVESLSKRMVEMESVSKKLSQALSRVSRKTFHMSTRTAMAANSVKELQKRLNKSKVSISGHSGAISTMARENYLLSQSMSRVGKDIDSVSNKIDRQVNKNNIWKRSFSSVKNKIDSARQSVKKIGDKLSNFETIAGGIAGVLGSKMIATTFLNFETAMNRLGAVSLANSHQMNKFRVVAKDLGATTQFTATQVAEGMVFLKQAGLSVNQTLQAIPGTLQLASAANLDLASAADIATNVLLQMGLPISKLTVVNDNLAAVQAKANTNVFEAAEAMKNVGTSASSLGVKISSITAMIGKMADAGVKGGEAGTLLRNAFLRLVNPNKKAVKELRRLKINLKDFVTPDGKIKNFTKLIDRLTKSGATTGQIFTIFQERGGRAIQALQKSGGKAIDQLTESLERANGSAERMAKIQLRGLPGVFLTLKSAFEALQIAIFESGFDQLLIKIGNKLILFTRSLSQTNPQIIRFVSILGLIATVAGPIAIAFSILSPIIVGLISPIGLLIGSIILLGSWITSLSSNNNNVRSSLLNLYSAFSLLGEIIKTISSYFDKSRSSANSFTISINALAAVVKVLLSPLELLNKILNDIKAVGTKEVFKGLLNIPLGLGKGVKSISEKYFSSIFSNLNEVGKGIKAKFEPIKTPSVIEKTRLNEISRQFVNPNQNNGIQNTAISDINVKNTLGGSINGTINVRAEKGTEITGSESEIDIPGNLGFNFS